MQSDRPRKLQRISQACDLCHRRSIRCRPSNEDVDRCQNCYDFDVPCTYDRPSKRRKHPAAPSAPAATSGVAKSQSQPGHVDHARSTGSPLQYSGHRLPALPDASRSLDSARGVIDLSNTTKESGDGKDVTGAYLVMQKVEPDTVSLPWKAFALSCESAMMELIDIYVDIVWPLYPLFHEETLKQRIRNRDHLVDRGFFACVMAICALASARVRDGALSIPFSEKLRHAELSSEVFYAAAIDAISDDLSKARGIDFLRTCALLALTCIQYGQIGTMQQHLGEYFTLSSVQRFYDEAHWPEGLSQHEVEIRRRVFWCVYTMDVVLEHALNKARAKKCQHEDRRNVDKLMFIDSVPDKEVMPTVLRMYYELPLAFKETPVMGENSSRSLYAFQAANIQATLQLLRMILFSMEDGPGVDRKCDVASEVLAVFHSIPPQYLRAISTPLIYHLGCMGQVLGSAMEVPLSDAQYQRVRASLLSMADLLDALESGLRRAAGASANLRSLIDKADEQMRVRRRLPQPVVMHPGPSTGVENVPEANMAGLYNFQKTLVDVQLPQELFGDWALPFDFYQGSVNMGPSGYPAQNAPPRPGQ
ncbi:hypothetical protein H2203_008796 [Taxawa tesnikishii (nom. ined.)]|nr:hypothetical protein H2203_008796 [Dothideales sp. JES 119]